MSYIYASSSYRTASDAATAEAFDYLTACGSIPRIELESLVAMSDDELWEELESAGVDDDWEFGSSGDYDMGHVDIVALRSRLIERSRARAGRASG